MLTLRDHVNNALDKAQVIVPCSGKFKTYYSPKETHRHYDFALNLSTLGSDAVSLTFVLETGGIGPLEDRLVRASLLLMNRYVVADIVDMRGRNWKVQLNRDKPTESAQLVFSNNCYLPISPAPASQFTLRITTTKKLGNEFCLKATPLYFVTSIHALFVPGSQHTLELATTSTPVTLAVCSNGQFFQPASLLAAAEWKPLEQQKSRDDRTYDPASNYHLSSSSSLKGLSFQCHNQPERLAHRQ